MVRVASGLRRHLLLGLFLATYLLAGLFAGPFLLAYLLVAPSVLAIALVRHVVLQRRGNTRYDEFGLPLRPGEHAAYVYVNDSQEPVRLVWNKDEYFAR